MTQTQTNNSSETPIITAADLSAGYRGSAVWGGASFSIRRGEFIGVLGPNGAGKTTLFRLLLGLRKPIRGALSVFGETPRRGDRRIGYVPQRHSVDTESAIETLEIVRLVSCGRRWGFDLPATARHERQVALAALHDVGAENLAHRALGSLSGGELQRVFLAQALSGHPEVLLLDEPLANLDIRREGEMVRLIKQVAGAHAVTVLLIAHNINPLLPALDRVMYVANGRVAAGAPGEVLNSESLSRLYDAPIEVLRDSRGRIAIIGGEEEDGHHHG